MLLGLIAAWFAWLCSLIRLLFRTICKRFLRTTTSLCELQRICYATEPGAERTLRIEHSLRTSRSRVIARIRDALGAMADAPGKFSSENALPVAQTVEFAVEAICEDKQINTKLHDEYAAHLQHKTYFFFQTDCHHPRSCFFLFSHSQTN